MAKGKLPAAFERSKADKEPKGVKEGSPRDEALDRRQAAGAGMPFKKSGKVKRR